MQTLQSSLRGREGAWVDSSLFAATKRDNINSLPDDAAQHDRLTTPETSNLYLDARMIIRRTDRNRYPVMRHQKQTSESSLISISLSHAFSEYKLVVSLIP